MEAAPKHTALQAHVAFFDPDNDGVIWPSDTYNAFRAIHFSILLSLICTAIIHGSFSYLTLPPTRRLPDPRFRLLVAHMHQAKHHSDSRAFTRRGALDAARFEQVWRASTRAPHTHMTFAEGVRMLKRNRDPVDLPFGWFAAVFEWLATYIMLWPARGSGGVKKEDVRGTFDGTIFYKISGRPLPASMR
ncbi:hypothetical protein PLICRDRAFT_163775, partial [Plicaturopsis crispa FD-325 SS-3]